MSYEPAAARTLGFTMTLAAGWEGCEALTTPESPPS